MPRPQRLCRRRSVSRLLNVIENYFRYKTLRSRLISAALLASQPLLAETIVGRVVDEADGDTITVLDALKHQHKIRLSGIDAPEDGRQRTANLPKVTFSVGLTSIIGLFWTLLETLMVPETGIEPVRPLFTKAADFKSAAMGFRHIY